MRLFVRRVEGGRPPKRYGHAAVCLGSLFYVFGGWRTDSGCSNDMYVFSHDDNMWSKIDVPVIGSPARRMRHTLTRDRSKAFLFGGIDGDRVIMNDLWIFDGTTMEWTRPTLNTMESPSARYGHSCVKMQLLGGLGGSALFVFGGFFAGVTTTNDFWTFKIDEMSWKRGVLFDDPMMERPKKRAYHCATCVNHTMLIFGGKDGDGNVYGDMWRLDMDVERKGDYTEMTGKWKQIVKRDQEEWPCPRYNATLTEYGPQMLLIGGNDASGQPLSDCWMFNFYTSVWSKETTNGSIPFPVCESHAAAFVLNRFRVSVFGGRRFEDVYDDVFDFVFFSPITQVQAGSLSSIQSIRHALKFINRCEQLIRSKHGGASEGPVLSKARLRELAMRWKDRAMTPHFEEEVDDDILEEERRKTMETMRKEMSGSVKRKKVVVGRRGISDVEDDDGERSDATPREAKRSPSLFDSSAKRSPPSENQEPSLLSTFQKARTIDEMESSAKSLDTVPQVNKKANSIWMESRDWTFEFDSSKKGRDLRFGDMLTDLATLKADPKFLKLSQSERARGDPPSGFGIPRKKERVQGSLDQISRLLSTPQMQRARYSRATEESQSGSISMTPGRMDTSLSTLRKRERMTKKGKEGSRRPNVPLLALPSLYPEEDAEEKFHRTMEDERLVRMTPRDEKWLDFLDSYRSHTERSYHHVREAQMELDALKLSSSRRLETTSSLGGSLGSPSPRRTISVPPLSFSARRQFLMQKSTESSFASPGSPSTRTPRPPPRDSSHSTSPRFRQRPWTQERSAPRTPLSARSGDRPFPRRYPGGDTDSPRDHDRPGTSSVSRKTVTFSPRPMTSR
eukprot:TRINITY_DN1399_c0_g1_i1.p1 TRINITY_DN1399_c0_g1~~TRINITY_DN1399_c0_g1_i1.p1  ORF type:complete len:847 (+),score=197.61 TRINITY_DN1399_c0_g1_i1:138-2678(+)